MKDVIRDYNTGERIYTYSDNMAMDFDGNMLIRISEHQALDWNSNEIHYIDSWNLDEPEEHGNTSANRIERYLEAEAMGAKVKSKGVALFLCFFFGGLGAHKFYEGNIKLGILYLCTLGLLGIGPLLDFFFLLSESNPYYVFPKTYDSSTESTPRYISYIKTIGSNDSQEPFPTGVYSSVISEDFSVVYFHMFLTDKISKLRKKYGKFKEMNIKWSVYDELGNCIYSENKNHRFKANADKISVGIILRGNGSSVAPGTYNFVVSINETEPMSLPFIYGTLT